MYQYQKVFLVDHILIMSVLLTSISLLTSGVITLYDATSLVMIQSRNANFGFQRAFASIAAIVAAPVGGMLVDATGDFRSVGNKTVIQNINSPHI